MCAAFGTGSKCTGFLTSPFFLPEDISVSTGAVRAADQEGIQPGRAASNHSFWGLEAVEMQAKTQKSGQFRLPLCIASLHQICCCFLWHRYTERWVQVWSLAAASGPSYAVMDFKCQGFPRIHLDWKQQGIHGKWLCTKKCQATAWVCLPHLWANQAYCTVYHSRERCIMYECVTPQKEGK